VVDLVEDDEGPSGLGARPVQGGLRSDLRVRDGDTVELTTVRALAVLEGRVELDADAGRGVRPLPLEVLRRADSSSSVATRRANVVLPAPGVATARKSCGVDRRYADSASCCQARSFDAVPQGARSGKAGGRCAATAALACLGGWDDPCTAPAAPLLTGSRR
jgi:hypothetical protein